MSVGVISDANHILGDPSVARRTARRRRGWSVFPASSASRSRAASPGSPPQRTACGSSRRLAAAGRSPPNRLPGAASTVYGATLEDAVPRMRPQAPGPKRRARGLPSLSALQTRIAMKRVTAKAAWAFASPTRTASDKRNTFPHAAGSKTDATLHGRHRLPGDPCNFRCASIRLLIFLALSPSSLYAAIAPVSLSPRRKSPPSGWSPAAPSSPPGSRLSTAGWSRCSTSAFPGFARISRGVHVDASTSTLISNS